CWGSLVPPYGLGGSLALPWLARRNATEGADPHDCVAGPYRFLGATAGGGDFGGVEGGLASFFGQLFVGERLGGWRLNQGGQLELVHVDPVGQAQEPRGDAAAVDHGAFGANFGLVGRIAGRSVDRALGKLDKTLHF